MSGTSTYGAAAEEIRQLFGDYIDGAEPCAVLAISHSPLGDDARNAIEKSLEAFGYGANASTYASLRPIDPSVEGGDIELDAQALFLLIEGLDPLSVIIADEKSAQLAGQAYRTSFEPDSPARVFGRPGVSFRDLAALLDSDDGKQRAWKLLKSIPKR